MTKVQAKALNIDTQDVVVASTGVIGVPLNIDAIINGIPCLTKSLSKDVSKLYAAIGKPNSSEYASSCIGDGEDGLLYYNGFTVTTYRENGKETVQDAY